MTWIGNPAMPEIVYGFGASLNYKGFDFSFLFQGRNQPFLLPERRLVFLPVPGRPRPEVHG